MDIRHRRWRNGADDKDLVVFVACGDDVVGGGDAVAEVVGGRTL